MYFIFYDMENKKVDLWIVDISIVICFFFIGNIICFVIFDFNKKKI